MVSEQIRRIAKAGFWGELIQDAIREYEDENSADDITVGVLEALVECWHEIRIVLTPYIKYDIPEQPRRTIPVEGTDGAVFTEDDPDMPDRGRDTDG